MIDAFRENLLCMVVVLALVLLLLLLLVLMLVHRTHTQYGLNG